MAWQARPLVPGVQSIGSLEYSFQTIAGIVIPARNMDTSLAQHIENQQLQVTAHAYTAACMASFAIGLQVLPSKPAMRTLWAFLVSTLYLVTQPLIYATSTQPQSIGIASVAMMVSWTILDWGLLQQPTSRPSPSQVYKSLFDHVMFGVAKVHRRRSKARDPAGASHAATRAMHAAEGSLDEHTNKSQERKPVVHIDASGAHEARGEKLLVKRSATVAQNRRPTSDGAAAGLLLSSDDSTTAAAAASSPYTSTTKPLVQALWVLARLVVKYDVGFAVLCCISGNMWKATALQQPLDQGPLGALLGPRLAYYAFHYGVSFLLPMQMGIAYASIKVVIILLGQKQLADSLPAEAFNSPVLSTSISDLWGNRWHQFLRYYFQGLGYTLVDKTARPVLQQLLPVQWQKSALATARSLVVFAMSGVWHEYITWAAYGVVTGKYMAFFMLHGLAVIIASYAVHLVPKKVQARIPYWLKRVYATAFMVLTTPLFTVPYQQHGYLQYCFHPFLVPVTATIARWAGICAC